MESVSGKHSVFTYLPNTVDTIILVQTTIFPGNPEKINEVPAVDEETKSHSH